MKTLLSWNVNGLRACAGKGFLDWLSAQDPDFVCLQETKANPDQLAAELLNPVDGSGKPYKAYWSSAKRKGYSGTAIFARREASRVESLGLPEFDDEGRTVIADFDDFVLISAYFPNSQDKGARLDYKLRFCAAMVEYCDSLRAKGRHLVLAGDYNIAHKPIDLARPEQNEANPGYLPEERAWMDSFTGAGYVDSFRRLCPEPGKYTWWTYRVPSARANNIGWRLDYHCIDPEFLPALLNADIQAEVRGSDHCPVSLELDI
ncbi:MAG: exodeoxyribonuclease III [Spirochaetia bacterium]|jgi:exodeoxyribonuclease-3|nr:exodeoxyribonuclease III [Spirochaetales bacterium]MDX9784121.1 exodeoxyribonuclease III [Spirochaetia bacterium]